jgi:phosphoglycerate dehydrogenase-like enzyme
MDVLIADTVEPEVLSWLGARHSIHVGPELVRDTQALRQHLARARAVIAAPAVQLDAAALRMATELRAIGRLTPSIDNIDLPSCAARGIEIVRASGASVQAEAEFAVGALLQMLRRVPVISPEGLLVGRELGHCTVGIVGMPPAARPLADLLRGFGSRVVGYDPGLHASDPLWERWSITPMGLLELVGECDAVVVLLNYFSRYRGLLGERYLQACKQDQVMVNLSSALILEEAALAEALTSGRLAAAWLDHVEPGLVAPGRPLHQIDSLQITPRVAGSTLESHLRASWDVARRIDEILNERARARGAAAVRVPPASGRAGYPGGPAPG